MKKREYFTKEELKSFPKLLFVRADTKRILAVEFTKGRKRVALNKEREVRRTKAGGWAQKKFERHVKWLKSQTLEWHRNNLEKAGVLRPPYDIIKIECRDAEQRKNIIEILQGKGKELISSKSA